MGWLNSLKGLFGYGSAPEKKKLDIKSILLGAATAYVSSQYGPAAGDKVQSIAKCLGF